MRTTIAIILSCVMISTMSLCQEEPKPTISSDSLTPEQIAIYRVVLESYRKGDKGMMNLADRTDPLQRTEGSSDQSCMNGIRLSDSTVIHRISNAAVLGPGLVLVDPDRQQEQIDKNDPQNLMKRAIDDHQKVTDKELEDTIKLAFETGVFTLSEIAFDRSHRQAVVAYSFVCGGLCGSGGTLLLQKVGQRWRIKQRCGGWVS